MNTFLTSLFGGRAKAGPRATRARLALEALEQRQLLDATPVVAGGVLSLTAGDNGDTIQVLINKNVVGNVYDDEALVIWTHGNGNTTTHSEKIWGNYRGTHYLRVSEINVEGGTGNDTITNDTHIRSVLRGHAGNDTITGGSGRDKIEGGLGSDVLAGRGGDDHLYATWKGWDKDTYGWSYYGNDQAVDTLRGGDHDDVLFGARGNLGNTLFGGGGDDILVGGDHAFFNHLFGGAGNDYMKGGLGLEVVNVLFDHVGQDTFAGGQYAMNIMDADDGGNGTELDDYLYLPYGATNVYSATPLEPVYQIWEKGDTVSVVDGVSLAQTMPVIEDGPWKS